MKIEQRRWTNAEGWSPGPLRTSFVPQLAFIFGSRAVLESPIPFEEIKTIYPTALLFGCSTAGEICGDQVLDDSLVVTAVEFQSTNIKSANVRINSVGDSYQAGLELGSALDKAGLVHILVLSEGLKINGNELVKGLTSCLPNNVSVTGGLAADGSDFVSTLVVGPEGRLERQVAAVGLYGERLKVGYGSMGGWDPFGPERLVTRSTANVLYELDGRSALKLYKQYLGVHADELPASGLLFPLSLRGQGGGKGVVRTILSVSDEDQSMAFAGDIPEGSYVRLMKANFDRLIDGAVGAAEVSYEAIGSTAPELALLISCVGRKLVLKQRIEEEVEGVREVLGRQTIFTGFYSYGEISPFAATAKCELHNQTMTITTLSEV